jgi:hypothetical protein
MKNGIKYEIHTHIMQVSGILCSDYHFIHFEKTLLITAEYEIEIKAKELILIIVIVFLSR